MPMKPSLLAGAALGLTAYIGSFYLLMVPNAPAYGAYEQHVFSNSPRFTEIVRVPGTLSFYASRANFLNYVFYPFEWIYSDSRAKKRPGTTLPQTSTKQGIRLPDYGAPCRVTTRHTADCAHSGLDTDAQNREGRS